MKQMDDITKKQYVTFETAKLAKEKGFNEKTDSLKAIAFQAFSEEELSGTEVKVWDDLLKLTK